jgi:hypothetical protein
MLRPAQASSLQCRVIEILWPPSLPERREGFIRTSVPAYEATAGAKREPVQADRRVDVSSRVRAGSHGRFHPHGVKSRAAADSRAGLVSPE